jgi:bla regulator protein BlaR1
MSLLLLFQIQGNEIIQALNWTLVHSLWQGMILSVIAGIIVFVTKKSSPSLRYNLLTGFLLVFMIAIAATFGNQISKAKEAANAVQMIPTTQTSTIEPIISSFPAQSKLSVPVKAVLFLNANASLIVLTWLLVIGFQFIRLTAGLYGVYQIKRKQVFSAGEYWNNRIAELGTQLQITKQVHLLQSGLAKIPAVIGYFKPVILFPAGMLASLPVNEVEAILLHELAHIRRKDFLVNVLQNMMEIIFFFNPAVLWVSSLIKSERENCCDDIVVIQTNNKQNYIKALMSFQQFDLPLGSPLSNAFSGEKNHLMNRIKRIIYNNNKTLNNMEKKFLITGMVVTSLFILAFSSNNADHNGFAEKIIPQVVNMSAGEKIITNLPLQTDTIPAKPSNKDNEFSGKMSTTVNGKKYTMVIENNQVNELYVNGKKIPDEKIGEYKTITDKLLKQAKSDGDQSDKEWEEAALGMQQSKKDLELYQLQLEQARIEMERSRKDIIKNIEKVKDEIAESKKEVIQEKIDKDIRIEMEKYQNETANELEKVKKEIELSKSDMTQAKINKEIKIEMEKYREDRQREMKQAKIEIEQVQKQVIQSKKEMEQAKIEMANAKKDMEQSKILQKKLSKILLWRIL